MKKKLELNQIALESFVTKGNVRAGADPDSENPTACLESYVYQCRTYEAFCLITATPECLA